MAALFAIASSTASAQDAPPVVEAQVRDYRPVFQECHPTAVNDESGAARIAIRRMEIDGTAMVLTVDPARLTTRLEREQDLACADTGDEDQKDTRYSRAIGSPGAAPASDVIVNGGLVRGSTPGSFITGDLCPSHRPLDRAFLEKLAAIGSPTPVALSISGLWLIRHQDDFQWLRTRERAGALRITWVDHSYHHPYFPGRRFADNFLLAPGVDMQAEVLDTERLLIAKGETPSVFFRFPGLISSPALMRTVRDLHLIVLGADAWLARTPRARAGDIVLVHLNGNEPGGLEIFSTLLAAGKLPGPFRPIEDAP